MVDIPGPVAQSVESLTADKGIARLKVVEFDT